MKNNRPIRHVYAVLFFSPKKRAGVIYWSCAVDCRLRDLGKEEM